MRYQNSFQNFSLLFFYLVLKFRKFEPRYSYKIYSYQKKSVVDGMILDA